MRCCRYHQGNYVGGWGSEEMAQPQIQTGQLASMWYFEPRLSLLFRVLPTAKSGLSNLPQPASPLITQAYEAQSHLCLEQLPFPPHMPATSLVPTAATSEGPVPTTCPQVLLPTVVLKDVPSARFLPSITAYHELICELPRHDLLMHTFNRSPHPRGRGASLHSVSSALEPTTEGPNARFFKAMTGSSIYHPGKRIS